MGVEKPETLQDFLKLLRKNKKEAAAAEKELKMTNQIILGLVNEGKANARDVLEDLNNQLPMLAQKLHGSEIAGEQLRIVEIAFRLRLAQKDDLDIILEMLKREESKRLGITGYLQELTEILDYRP
jgi:hypothetical protein